MTRRILWRGIGRMPPADEAVAGVNIPLSITQGEELDIDCDPTLTLTSGVPLGIGLSASVEIS